MAAKIRCFVLFDTETTGLPSVGNNPRITELCLLALTRNELASENSSPRVLNKLLLCFNPMKMISSAACLHTGLHNDSLEELSTFKTQASLVCQFLKNLPHPVCLVAHNGNKFDFPLLVAHLEKGQQMIPEDVLCADSLEAFRAFDGLPPVPEFLQTRGEKSSEDQTSSKRNALNGVPFGNDNLSAASSTEAKDLVNSQSISSPVRKRGLENCQEPTRDAEQDSRQDDESSGADLKVSMETFWDTSGAATPAKKTSRLIQEAPTKRLPSPNFSPGMRVEYKGPQRNPIRGVDTLDKRAEFVQNERKLQGGNVSTIALSKGEVGCDGLVESQEEKVQCTRDSSQEGDALSKDQSLTDSEKLFLEAVEESERLEAQQVNNDLVTKPVGEAVSGTANPENSGDNTPVVTRESALGKTYDVECQKKVSYSLPKLYARTFGQEPLVSHTAEDDCITMLKIIRNAAIKKFPQWCDENAVPLKDITSMY
ncbi:three prime repair exonuclease 1 [Plakobranchus ocellatus]|uniref:Three prime repair exonuclease 1 n=1 Tax=Plakobranchus ocellatus TaxID=259542 RepID=A0AAV3Z145_9GAST|nr:three prime repair exonuclease 1 [Plakobranchus ocellatus]